MHRFIPIIVFTAVFTTLILVLTWAIPELALAESSFFSSRCAQCHDDDTPTCAGCHNHRGTISAAADKDIYDPSEPMVVMLTRVGGRSGWIRGTLYDHENNVIAVASGPSGTGDDGLGDPVTFPVTFDVTAPVAEGEYTWRAAYFGNNNAGSSHYEESRNIVFQIVDSQEIAEWWLQDDLGAEMQVSVFPNPIADHGTFKFSLGANADHEVSLSLVDATGRLVRQISEGRYGEGIQELHWDGADRNGRPVGSGVYLAILSSGGQHVTRPVLVLR